MLDYQETVLDELQHDDQNAAEDSVDKDGSLHAIVERGTGISGTCTG